MSESRAGRGRVPAAVRTWGVLVLAGGVAVASAGCKKSAAPPAMPPAEVGVVTVAARAVPVSYEFSAEVQPYRRVEVRSRVDGIIEARPFTEGQLVKPGEVLFRIDPVRTNAAYASAKARADNARRTVERLEPLLAQHAVAQQDVDNARAELEAADAALAQAREDRQDATVRAEIAGRVGRALLDVGARVTGPADLLTTIDVVDPVYVAFRPSTQQLLQWRQDPRSAALLRPGSGLRVQVTLPDGTVLPRTAKLDYVAPSLDPATGTQEFRATFPNSDHLLAPGQFVRVRLEGFTRDSAFAVPQRAVQQALGRQFVYVVGKGDTVAARDVQPGPWSGNLWIIDKGLAAGDRVIVDGAQKTGPGRPVHPVPASDSAATAAPAAGGEQKPGAGTPGAETQGRNS
ncbi:MAG TPA: efflux RND transporter periplasmic adaptor subunit [Gemmatimonadales bacterium]|nr:efflux RND transporter periplasmic adaptor subunit [Gemmatimonadales bacterium]